MNNFLDHIFDFDEFETAFSLFHQKVRKEVNMFDLEQIDKFQPNTRSYRLSSVIGSIYRQFKEVEDEYCIEQEVKDYIKEAYLKFQKFEELEIFLFFKSTPFDRNLAEADL